MSFFFAPAASNARIKRSSETAGSLASILATRDWLERRRFANSLCERPRLVRHFFKLALKVSLSSTKAASSSDSPRNSRAEPTFHPAASSFFRLLTFMLLVFRWFCCFIIFQAALTLFDHSRWRLLSRLPKDFQNHDRVAVDSVDNPPTLILILYSQFMTTRANTGHRS